MAAADELPPEEEGEEEEVEEEEPEYEDVDDVSDTPNEKLLRISRVDMFVQAPLFLPSSLLYRGNSAVLCEGVKRLRRRTYS